MCTVLSSDVYRCVSMHLDVIVMYQHLCNMFVQMCTCVNMCHVSSICLIFKYNI